MSKLGSWSTTAGSNNTTPPDGWPEGQAPSTVNDCAREMMAQIRTAFNDLQFFDQNMTPTYISASSFSVTGDQTSAIHAGRRLKVFDATAGVATTIYATVLTASFTVVTTVSVSVDGGQLTSSLSSFAISILSNTNQSLPRDIAVNVLSASTLEADILNISLSAYIVGTSITPGFLSISSGATSGGIRLNVSSGTANQNLWNLRVGGTGNQFLIGVADDTGSLGDTLSIVRSATTITNVNIPGNVNIDALSVSTSAVIKSTLSVGGAVTFGSTFTASGAVILKTTLTVSGAVVLNATLTVSGAVALNSTLSVSGTIAAANVAKAWTRFDITSPPTVVSSFNVASISRSAVGVVRITFTTAFVDTSFLWNITYNAARFVQSVSIASGSVFKFTTVDQSLSPTDAIITNAVFYR